MKRLIMLAAMGAVLALAVGCGNEDDPIDTSQARFTDGGSFFVMWSSGMHPSTEHTDMTMNFMVHGDDQVTLIDTSSIVADARTTQHGGHGMPTGTPVVTSNNDGTFSATPYNFPHGGHWIYEVTVTDNGNEELVEFNVIVESEGEHHDE